VGAWVMWVTVHSLQRFDVSVTVCAPSLVKQKATAMQAPKRR
jgi:hypothetical protein